MRTVLRLTSLQLTLRDYPLPLVDVPPFPNDKSKSSLVFQSDVIIAEEMGSSNSVDWIDCIIADDAAASSPFILSVPKTIMPVK